MRNIIFIFLFLFFTLSVSAQTAEELIEKGYEAYLDYDFEKAGADFAAARKKLKKASNATLDEYSKRLETAESFLERVEKIVVIDSLTMPKSDFFRRYRIPVSSGSLRGAEALPVRTEGVDFVFTNEGEDFKMWAMPDSTGNLSIFESIRLTDGSWQEPQQTPEILNGGGNARFPFMMADGVTLYYASDGEESIGGYDIFVATRDAADGEYLQPQNIGMPYNSPFDDYMLAIDELNGVGWWATDRNQLGVDLTVYVFIVNDLRKNYPVDEEDIISFAAIDDYHATWNPDEDYSGLLNDIRAINPEAARKKADFHFPVKGGKIYTSLDDFSTNAQKTAMKRFLEAEKELKDAEKNLGDMRRKFAATSSSTIAARIRELENKIEQTRSNVEKLRSDVYKTMKE